MFKNSTAKLAIGSLDNASISVEAHYNPKELAAQLTVPWAARNAQKDAFDIEFTGAQPKTMELEMLFDCFEGKAEDGKTVQQQLDLLEVLASPRLPYSDKADELRPHYCIVTWGDQGPPALRCVITSLATKVTMFSREGTPLRAVANVKVQQVHVTQQSQSDNEIEQWRGMQRRMAARDLE
jgi:hypothetical protein